MGARPFRFGVGPGAIEVRVDPDLVRLRRGASRTSGTRPSRSATTSSAPTGPSRRSPPPPPRPHDSRVGALTFGNDYRHPVVLAQEAATLDLLSDGRLEFGIGAGWMHADYERAGLSLDPAGTRVDRLEEALAVIKGLWSGEPLEHHGRHYRIAGLAGRPRPVQRPHPPVLIGGSGDRVLSLAAREADIVGLNVNLRAGHLGPEMATSATREATGRKVALVRDAAAGRSSPPEIQVYVHVVAIGGRGEGVARGAAALGLDEPAAAASPHVLAGSIDEIVGVLEERRAALGISYVSVSAESVDAMAPVVARLAGH